MNCRVCNRNIDDGEVIKCNGCKVSYHYKCVNITTAAFREGQVQLKRNFKCDSCANVTQRVRVTDDTPVRGIAAVSKIMESNQSLLKNTELMTSDEMIDKVSSVIITKINTFELNIIQEIKDTVAVLALENSRLRQELKEANMKCNSYEQQIKHLKTEIPISNSQSSVHYASKTSQCVNAVAGESILVPPAPAHPPARAPAPAPISANCDSSPLTPRPNISYAAVASKTAILQDVDRNSEWTEVRGRKKYNYPVNRGGNTSIKALKVVERKKYLHVWRLEKETTEESLREHIQGVLDGDAEIIVKKIGHKTERDYASFRIGVSERNYEKICDPDVWPLNVEYCEWIWFRPSTKTTLPEPHSK